MSPGIVYLVGAGPGQPKLITVRGLEVLERADVVLYDRLVSDELLARARDEAQRIYVGKRRGDEVMPQAEIEALLIQLARQGKSVCRLKGGDPFIFGRGGEEALALAAAGVAFEVVPGVSAGLAAPAFAGIPLTHRNVASSVALVTGHDEAGASDARIDWQRLATAADTIVVFMGVLRIAEITRQLMAGGRAAETPVAVVRWGSTPKQVVLTGTLADIAEQVAAAQLRPPAIIVIGAIVNLREQLNWFESQPLFGKRIVVTRPREQATELVSQLEACGAEVSLCPLIRIVPREDMSEIDRAIEVLQDWDWIVFTSVNAVDLFVSRVDLANRRATLLTRSIAAVGPATAARLQALTCAQVLVSDEFLAEGLLDRLANWVRGKRVLLPQADSARPVLRTGLENAGACVAAISLYHTVADERGRAALSAQWARGGVDAVTLSSGSAARQLAHLIRSGSDEARLQVPVICIGATTQEVARSLGLNVVAVAEEPSSRGMAAALVQWAQQNSP